MYKKAIRELTDMDNDDTLLPCEARALILGNDCESVDDLVLRFLAEEVFVEGVAEQDKDRIASYIVHYSPLMTNTTDNKEQVLNELAKSGIKFVDVPVTSINKQKLYNKPHCMER